MNEVNLFVPGIFVCIIPGILGQLRLYALRGRSSCKFVCIILEIMGQLRLCFGQEIPGHQSVGLPRSC